MFKINKNREVEFIVSQGEDILELGSIDKIATEKLIQKEVRKYKFVLQQKRREAIKLTEERGQFMFVYQYMLESMAHESWTGREIKVLFYIMSQISYGNDNYIDKTHKEIAEILKMERSHVTACLSKLKKKGHIIEIKSGTRKYLTINPDLGFKGNIRQTFKSMEEQENRKRNEEIKNLMK